MLNAELCFWEMNQVHSALCLAKEGSSGNLENIKILWKEIAKYN